MSTEKILTQKEKELIAVAASIASGCVPCTTHHIKSLRGAGASEAEMLSATRIALDVRDTATEMMAEIAQGNLNYEYPREAQSASMEQPIDDLVAIGAALACNSVAGLEYYWTKASAAGVSTYQFQTAIGIARSIIKEAAKKAEITSASLVESTPANTDQQAGGCCQNTDHSPFERSNENPAVQAENRKESVPPPCSCS